MAQMVKNLQTQVRSLGREDPLEKGMATHSSILDLRIPQREETGGLQSMGLQRVGHDWLTKPTLLTESLINNIVNQHTFYTLYVLYTVFLQ